MTNQFQSLAFEVVPDEVAEVRFPGDALALTPTRPAARAPHSPEAGPAPAILQPGNRLGQYRLLERLGQGGMAVVFKAVHILLRRVVALKILPAEHLGDKRAVARFRQEMRALGRLGHPHIVQASDARLVRGIPFLVMEFVEGLDLARLVGRAGPLAVPDACELTRQTAVGLQHAHAHGLVHRDLKPANLMLAAPGQVKILDLGLALWYGEPYRNGQAATGGGVVGTADYMAPEQARGVPVDGRADLYSLGCTLFELLSGRTPFSGPRQQTVAQKLRAHVRAALPSVQRLRPEVPRALAQVLGRLLAKDPADRWGEAAEVEAALRLFTGGSDLTRLLRTWEPRPDTTVGNPLTGPATMDYRPNP
jgi:serine/threonine protein kinase